MPPAGARIDEHGPSRRHWARLPTYCFVLYAVALQSVALLPLIGCNPFKAISARTACVLYCSGVKEGGKGENKGSLEKGGSEKLTATQVTGMPLF